MRISANWLQKCEQRLRKIKMLQKLRINSKVVETAKQSSTFEGIAKTKQSSRAVRMRWHWLRRGTRKDYMHIGTFQEAIKPILMLAQVFSLMPVRGITAASVHRLSFAWTNLRSIYAMLTISCFGITSGFTAAYAVRNNMTFDSVETTIFYTSIFVISLVFFNLARKWPALSVHWDRVERNLPPMRTESERSLLAHRIKMIALVTTMCSLMEHLLSMLSIIYYVNACPARTGQPIQSFLYSNFSQFFYFVDFTTVAGIFGKVVNVLSTFAWNFNDIFVMAISVALSARFRQLNEHMRRAVKRPTSAEFWVRCRINYRNLCRLCDTTDDAIATITMLCFTNNLYFICSKILKSLQKKPTFTHTLYFWFSLCYLLVRTFMLSLFAAEINDESKKPLVIFRCIARSNWCPELKRFSEEVNTDVVALSGMKFFQITRGLVLSVAGTIVTYELVLLQFNKQDKVNDCFER